MLRSKALVVFEWFAELALGGQVVLVSISSLFIKFSREPAILKFV